MNRVVAAAFVASVLFAAACDENLAAVASCETDADCSFGVCAFSLCVDPSALGTVDLEVEPQAGTNVPPQSLLGVDVAGDDRVPLVLSPAVTVSGTVLDLDGNAIDAAVFAVPVDGIAGRLRQRTVTADNAGFALPLVRDQAYRFAATPSSPSLPPVYGDIDVIAGSGEARLQVAVVRRVFGSVVAGGAPGVAINSIADCAVSIVDGNDRLVSTVDITDLDGSFALAIGTDVVDPQLVLRPQGPYPAVRMPIVLGTATETGDPVPLGTLSLSETLTPRGLTGTVRNVDGSPAVGAVVVARGEIGNGIVSVRQVTDDAGAFSMSVVDGTYEVVAVGASTTISGIATLQNVTVAAAVSGLVLDLPARVRSALTVARSPDSDEPVAAASVVLTRIGAVDSSIAEPILKDAQPIFTGNTDEGGSVVLDVDPGYYRLVVQPPRGQALPAFSGIVQIAETGQRTIALNDARVFAGVLRNDSGAVVPGAFVRVFSPIVDERGQAVFLGETIADSDGAFAVSIPSFASP
ncbi:MAG TPA: carboxypeptidase-like regulatory domain-containing protein [Myxococcota bacterium]